MDNPRRSLADSLCTEPLALKSLTKSVGTPRGDRATQSSSDSALEDLILRFGYFLTTEEYKDNKPCSTLLVYFSGVLGILPDGATFERAKKHTTKLLGLIYCIRLIMLESTLA